MKVRTEVEHRNEPPSTLQVIVGAVEENLLEMVGELAIRQVASEHEGAVQALAVCQKNFALARLRWVAERAELNEVNVQVRIRFVDYLDYDLAKKIESIFKEHASKWSIEIDGTNKPVLRPADEFKVVFDCGFMQSYMEVASAFSDGQLAGVSVGLRRSDRFADGDQPPVLIVEVLPTIKKT